MRFALVAASAAVLLSSAPALAETIYLKNGTRVSGAIVKESEEQFTVQTSEGAKKTVLKTDIMYRPLPSTAMALATGLLIPGAGQVYATISDDNSGLARGALFFAMAAAGGGAGYLAARQWDPGYIPASLVIGIGVPTLLGAVDALWLAENVRNHRKYKIDY